MWVQVTNETKLLAGKTIEWIGFGDRGTVWVRFTDGAQIEMDPASAKVADVASIAVELVNPSAWDCGDPPDTESR